MGLGMTINDKLTNLVVNLRRYVRGGALDRLLRRGVFLFAKISGNLDLLAALSGTDKYGLHNYTPVYQNFMRQFRKKPIRLLEIGVGGYDSELGGGESLLMWATYFPKGLVYGIDINDKRSLSRGRIKVFQCSQTDRPRLIDLGTKFGPFDFIIDDGSHINAHQIEAFQILWPFVKDGGADFVEDVQTSYWPAFGGGPLRSPNSNYAHSCVSYFKGLVDSVNIPEFVEPADPEFQLDPLIGSIAFHHNLIVITKDSSIRQSNFPLGQEECRKAVMGPYRG